MTTTPPPPEVFCPDAPLHGPLYDPPHHFNRKSDRVKSQNQNRKSAVRTPSPDYHTVSFASASSEGPGELKRTPKQKRNPSYLSSRSSARRDLSPPSSPLGTDNAMPPNTRSSAKKAMQAELVAPVPQVGLPTPMKTPRKQVLHPDSAEAARVLFRHDTTAATNTPSKGDFSHLPTPMSKKRGKRMRKDVGFSLDDDGKGNDIEIYTDTREMIPEVDERRENPFYDPPGEPKRRYPKRHVSSEEAQRVEYGLNLLKADRGYYAVGRGRRHWKTLEHAPDAVPDSPTMRTEDDKQAYIEEIRALDDVEELRTTDKALKDNRAKPRRLFAEEIGAAELEAEDAEAPTDIEDQPQSSRDVSTFTHIGHGGVSADDEPSDHRIKNRQTRSQQKSDNVGTARKMVDVAKSPFDSWPRSKGGRTRAANANGKTVAATALDSFTEPEHEEADVLPSPVTTVTAATTFGAVKREGDPLDSASKRLRGAH